MIELRNCAKRFGTHTVLSGINLKFDACSVTAVLGPNGSGKTTLIKTILGLVRPDNGELFINEEPVLGTAHYRNTIGYMPQIARFQDNLTARELIAMIRDIREHPPGSREEELCSLFNLAPYLDKQLKTLSGGTRQKVNAVLAFMFLPQILMLDEPTAGLDPIAASIFKDLVIAERERGRTILLTSHIMSEVHELADTIVFLLEGNVYFQGTPSALLNQTGEITLERAIARLLSNSNSIMTSNLATSKRVQEDIQKSTLTFAL